MHGVGWTLRLAFDYAASYAATAPKFSTGQHVRQCVSLLFAPLESSLSVQEPQTSSLYYLTAFRPTNPSTYVGKAYEISMNDTMDLRNLQRRCRNVCLSRTLSKHLTSLSRVF